MDNNNSPSQNNLNNDDSLNGLNSHLDYLSQTVDIQEGNINYNDAPCNYINDFPMMGENDNDFPVTDENDNISPNYINDHVTGENDNISPNYINDFPVTGKNDNVSSNYINDFPVTAKNDNISPIHTNDPYKQ
ncbi:unnamed protein product [Rhizophagus irregularis]|nr:unnamed protein product [Rhizophagus irregularis]CAB4432620.1 unnamed protein product [Rhizophagus irregularis]